MNIERGIVMRRSHAFVAAEQFGMTMKSFALTELTTTATAAAVEYVLVLAPAFPSTYAPRARRSLGVIIESSSSSYFRQLQ